MMTRDQFAATVAKLVAGLQVPVSITGKPSVLGAGAEPWQELLHLGNHGFGWTNAGELEAAYRMVLGLTGKDGGAAT